MKGTEQFKKTLLAYLEDRAKTDELFAKSFSKEGKNIDSCITYILNIVKKSECNGYADEEIFGMAVHYYDEDNIEIGSSTSANVVVNHQVELTEEEKNQAKEKARKKFEELQLSELRKSQERKEAREKKKQEKLKKEEADRRVKKSEEEKRIAMAQQTLF
jgi:hypothetical protein